MYNKDIFVFLRCEINVYFTINGYCHIAYLESTKVNNINLELRPQPHDTKGVKLIVLANTKSNASWQRQIQIHVRFLWDKKEASTLQFNRPC